MILTNPELKKVKETPEISKSFSRFHMINQNPEIFNEKQFLEKACWNMPQLVESAGMAIELIIVPLEPQPCLDEYETELYQAQGYTLDITESEIRIGCSGAVGLLYGMATVKQLLKQTAEGVYHCPCLQATDWPTIAHRSLSTTFAWYAGYGRIGFDMQLWGFEEWKLFLHTCVDFKINQLNVILYGYWPFEFPEYPETVLKDMKMKVWNKETNGWLELSYMHPNLAQEFLPQLIAYGHELGIQFFAYIGLNSYSGGYACAHPEKRMKMPENSNFINDFDSLCLSDESTIRYLKKSMEKIIEQGFDGIDFEESEEAFWYCQCPKCKETFWKNCKTPEETLHAANTWLLAELHKEIKRISPQCVVGLRAWRQPPLVRSEQLIQEMVDSIPKDVVLFWSPGQYVEDSEFDKWIAAFGPERIYARDTEAIGFASCFGRLIRPFRWNGLRCEEEPIHQFIEEDIRQHIGSAERRVAGINGYQFEWYGFFMAFFAHSYYGWGGKMAAEDFYHHSLRCVFGDLEPDIYHVMTNMLTIHESQLNLYTLKYPFAQNKVEDRDMPRILEAIESYESLLKMLQNIENQVASNPKIAHFAFHFKKWEISLRRSRVIYDMAITSLAYENAKTEQEKRACLLELHRLNEQDFQIVKENYFDVNPVDKTGTPSCMIPCHELRRVIENELYPEKQNDRTIYVGVESLGWMWL